VSSPWAIIIGATIAAAAALAGLVAANRRAHKDRLFDARRQAYADFLEAADALLAWDERIDPPRPTLVRQVNTGYARIRLLASKPVYDLAGLCWIGVRTLQILRDGGSSPIESKPDKAVFEPARDRFIAACRTELGSSKRWGRSRDGRLAPPADSHQTTTDLDQALDALEINRPA
jgi:hypothetical protein